MSATTDKRSVYVENDFSENSDSDGSYFTDNQKVMGLIREKSMKQSKRQPKCFNKNALMARENRLKKKLYIESLEKNNSFLRTQNKNLSSIVDNQSFLIKDLRRQVKYLKSTLANSSDISMLMKTIHSNTGMSVTTSLDKSLKISNCISKPEVEHPWKHNFETSSISNCVDNSDKEDTFLNYSDPNDFLLFPQIEDANGLEETIGDTLNEHNYTAKSQRFR